MEGEEGKRIPTKNWDVSCACTCAHYVLKTFTKQVITNVTKLKEWRAEENKPDYLEK